MLVESKSRYLTGLWWADLLILLDLKGREGLVDSSEKIRLRLEFLLKELKDLDVSTCARHFLTSRWSWRKHSIWCILDRIEDVIFNRIFFFE